MDSTHTDITYNILTVTTINKTDKYEGCVTFRNSSGNELTAFFWGPSFEINRTYKIKFGFLEQPLKWDRVFSENKNKVQALEPTAPLGSYDAYGKIISINPITADFGHIILEIGEWTHDEGVIGEYIYFKLNRLDVKEVVQCT